MTSNLHGIINKPINKTEQRMERNRQSAARSRARHKMVVSELWARVNRLDHDLQVKTAQLNTALELLHSLSHCLLDQSAR